MMLKNFTNEQALKNKKLLTKQLRIKKEVELTTKNIEEAKTTKVGPPRTINMPVRVTDLES